MFNLVMTLSAQSTTNLDASCYELVMESLLRQERWKEALLVLQNMDKAGFVPSKEVCTALVASVEAADEYQASEALRGYLQRKGWVSG
jgi:pentatricopeptide repeat protein